MAAAAGAADSPSLHSMLDAIPVVGTFLAIPRFEVVGLLALVGSDSVVCGHEHALLSLLDATGIALVGVGRGPPVVVRVPELDRGDVNRLLSRRPRRASISLRAGDAAAGLRTLVS